MHPPRSTRPKTPGCLTQQLFQLLAQNRKIAPVWRPGVTRRCAASLCQRRCRPCGAAWSHDQSMRIFGFAAVKRGQEAPPSAIYRMRVVSQKSPSQPSLDVRGGWCSAYTPPLFITVMHRPHPCPPHRINELLSGTVISGGIMKV